jgi:hypothetical protein
LAFTRHPGKEPFEVVLHDFVRESSQLVTSIKVPNADFAIEALKLVGVLHHETEDYLVEREKILRNSAGIYTLSISRS